MYNHNKAQQSKNRVHISWDILYVSTVRHVESTYRLLKAPHCGGGGGGGVGGVCV